MKNPLTPAGIETATFRFVAQHQLGSRNWKYLCSDLQFTSL